MTEKEKKIKELEREIAELKKLLENKKEKKVHYESGLEKPIKYKKHAMKDYDLDCLLD